MFEDLYFQDKYAEAHELAHRLASEGDMKSTRFLGWMYSRGHGCSQDENKAMRFFQEAAERGDAETLYGIASIYYSKQDYENALRYLTLSMDAGFVPAIRWSGMLYHLGLGVKKDPKRAYELYHRAAQAGNLSAYHQKALMLLHGFRGIQGRLASIPMLIKFFACATLVAYRDKNSQRLM